MSKTKNALIMQQEDEDLAKDQVLNKYKELPKNKKNPWQVKHSE
jgi:hypothetical protein